MIVDGGTGSVGSDGTEGVPAIKGEGGMAMAQNPKSTEYDGMPRSAVDPKAETTGSGTFF